MAKHRPYRCRSCLGWSHEVGQISWGGLCAHCGDERLTAHRDAMANKRGPEYEAWLLACAASSLERATRLADAHAALDGQGHVDRSAAQAKP